MDPGPSDPHAIIIGAGPAGIASAVCLAERKIRYTLLERGNSPLAALRRVDPQMTLLSPSRLSRLPFMRFGSNKSRYLTFQTFVKAAEDYHDHHNIKVIINSDVLSVTRSRHGFVVGFCNPDGSRKFIEGSHVINATGIISSPRFPKEFDPTFCSFRWKHSIDVRTSDLVGARKLLVVGGGASAAEVFNRWLKVREPSSVAWLSLNSRLKAFVNPVLGVDIHYLLWLPEHIPAWLLGWRAGRLPELMNGKGVLPAIRKGTITVKFSISHYDKKAVLFCDGSSVEPDFSVFATGFRYATDHLKSLIDHDPDGRPLVCCCESSATPNLYLLGLRFGRTFASPYVRGIARDAMYVARRITRDSVL